MVHVSGAGQGGCAHYKTTLTNEKGETVVCEASGKTGPVSGSYLVRGYEACVNAAKANGFKEVPQTSSNRKRDESKVLFNY